MLRKRFANELLYRYGQAKRRFPLFFKQPLGFYFYITGRCNLNCSYCWQRDQARKQSESWHNAMTPELSPDEWQVVVRKLPRTTAFLGLSGGEVTVSKAFPVILKEAERRNLPVTVNTNGRSLTDEQIQLLTKKNVRNISISLDGFSDIHDQSRNQPGLFESIVQNIKRLNHIRGAKPSLTIKTVLMDENVEQLLAFQTFCEQELRADTLNISFMKTGDHAQFSFLCGDDLSAILSQRKATLHSYQNPKHLVEVLEALLRQSSRSRCDVEFFPRMKTVQQIQNFLNQGGRQVYQPCFLPWAMTTVLPDGEVIPCLSFRLGNVKEHGYDIRRVLSGKRYHDFLQYASRWRENLPEVCHVCCFAKTR